MKRFPVIETKMSFIDPYQHIIVSHVLFMLPCGRKAGAFLCMGTAGVACEVKLHDEVWTFTMCNKTNPFLHLISASFQK